MHKSKYLLLLIGLNCVLSLAGEPGTNYITSIIPNAGPMGGGTRITVRGNGFEENVQYKNPVCKFGSNDRITPAVYIKCTPEPWVGKKGDPPTEEKTASCLQCEYSPSSDVYDVVPLSVSLTGDFTDSGNSVSFRFYEDPIVERIDPNLGLKSGDTRVRVYGKNFLDYDQNLRCSIGTLDIDARFISENEVECITPASDVTGTPLQVGITLNNQQYTKNEVYYWFYDDPYISQIDPKKGPSTGGTTVELQGQYFNAYEDIGNDGVKPFNNAYCMFGPFKVEAEIKTDTKVHCISPPSYNTRCYVLELTLNDQQYTDDKNQFCYYNPPYVYDAKPLMGPTSGSTTVTIIGSNFKDTGEIKCKFGSKTVDGTFKNVNELECVSPDVENPGYVPLTISLANDEFSSSDLQYLYYEKPVIKSIDPICGPTTGYTQITVIGENFIRTGPDMVKCVFGGNIKMHATVFNETLIKCDSPPVVNDFGENVNNIWEYNFTITLNNDEVHTYMKFAYYTQPTLTTALVPDGGPITGGTRVNITGFDFDQPGTCKVVVRFSTIESNVIPKEGDENSVSTNDGDYTHEDLAEVYTDNYVIAMSPAVTIAEEVVVNVALNGQQFTMNNGDEYPQLFLYYPDPMISSYLPLTGPETGNTEMIMAGFGFVEKYRRVYKYDDKIGEAEILKQALELVQIRFINVDTEENYGIAKTTYVDNAKVMFNSPPGDAGAYARLEVSLNGGHDWLKCPGDNFQYLSAPRISDINPHFGPVKEGQVDITVTGTNFVCHDTECSNLFCKFGEGKEAIVRAGTFNSATEVICTAPNLSRPDVLTVEVSVNDGVDYTTDGHTYSYYDAFVLSLDPPMGPVEGGTNITVTGFGFADTGDHLKCRFGDADQLDCDGSDCIFQATEFVNKHEIICTTQPQDKVTYKSGGQSIGFNKHAIEISIYNDEFTNEQIPFKYYTEPELIEAIPDTGPANGGEYVIVKTNYHFDDGINEQDDFEDMEKLDKIICRWTDGENVQYTQAAMVHYPLDEVNGDPNGVGCNSPEWPQSGLIELSVTFNGQNYIPPVNYTYTATLDLTNMYPKCGPNEGNTLVRLVGKGFESPNELHINWGTESGTVVGSHEAWYQEITLNTLYARTVPTAEQKTHGGFAFIEITRHSNLEDDAEGENILIESHTMTMAEFWYYRTPVVELFYPKVGPAEGGTVVHIEGANFRELPSFNCTAWCMFGDQYVRATWVSSVRLECASPPMADENTVQFGVSLNGYDWTTVDDNGKNMVYKYYEYPVIYGLEPISGPVVGGTMISVKGANFTDLGDVDHFFCRFRSISMHTEDKIINARRKDNSTIICMSPGGWESGNTASVEITFNGLDYTHYNHTFQFYDLHEVIPRSGPANGLGGYIEIKGSGFVVEEHASCVIDNVEYAPEKFEWNTVYCPMPAHAQGPKYWGTVLFDFTLNGVDWRKFTRGFQYYEQPYVTAIEPHVGPATGGSKLTIYGKKFRNDHELLNLGCKTGDGYGKATFVSSEKIDCITGRAHVTEYSNVTAHAALNNYSWTEATANTVYYVYDVFHITPNSGPVEGGSNILVHGIGFTAAGENSTPRCRIGVSDNYQIMTGKVINDNQMICTTESGFNVPSTTNLPLTVPFSVAFIDNKYEPWTNNHVKFKWYSQPRIKAISPSETYVKNLTDVYIQAAEGSHFHKTPPIYEGGSGHEMNSHYGMVCKFGDYGQTTATYVNSTHLKCHTPDTGLDPRNIYQEEILFQVAMNGKDWTTDDVRFTFTGDASGAFVWLYLLALILAVLLIFGILALCTMCMQSAAKSASGWSSNMNIRGDARGGGVDNSRFFRDGGDKPRVIKDNDGIPRPRISNFPDAADAQMNTQSNMPSSVSRRRNEPFL